jgi:hypothetical protein
MADGVGVAADCVVVASVCVVVDPVPGVGIPLEVAPDWPQALRAMDAMATSEMTTRLFAIVQTPI